MSADRNSLLFAAGWTFGIAWRRAGTGEMAGRVYYVISDIKLR